MTDEELKKARWVDRGISLLIVIIGIVGTSWVAGITNFKEKLANKADKEYVKDQIKHHEDKEMETYLRLENLIILSLEKQEAVVNSIDRRLERIEDKE